MTSSGALDSSFGTDGQLILPFEEDTTNMANTIVAQSDNSFYVGGRLEQLYTPFSSIDMGLAHVLANGTLDPNFGDGGYTRVNIKPGNASQINSLALDSSGYIIASGNIYSRKSDDYAVSRFTPTGALDTTFTSKGYLRVHVSNGHNALSHLAMQSDGKIIMSGSAFNGIDFEFGTTRVTP